MSALLDKRLLVVTDKGGAGKTTLAVALGLAAARHGKRVVLCEVAGSERISRLAPELTTVSVDPEEAKREWLRYQLKSRTLAGVLGGSSLFQYLTAAAPGLTELVTIGKVWDLAQLEPRTGGPAFDLAIDAILVNAVHPARFRPEECRRLEAVEDGSRVARAALDAALAEHRRARGEHAQVRRLRRAAAATVVTLPRIFEPELGRHELERLSAELE